MINLFEKYGWRPVPYREGWYTPDKFSMAEFTDKAGKLCVIIGDGEYFVALFNYTDEKVKKFTELLS